MDATKSPLTIPPDISNYAEKHGLFDLYQRLLSELIVAKPNDPLELMIEFLKSEDDDVARILVHGPPASGRASISVMLSRALGAVHVTMDDIMSGADSQLVDEAKSCLEKDGQQLSAKLWAQLVHSRLTKYDTLRKGWILDSVISNKQQVIELCILGVFPKHCVLLEAADSVLIERASGKRVDPETDGIYHITFDWPLPVDVATRIMEVPGYTEAEVIEQLVSYHRNVDGIKSAFQHVSKCFNADQPKADVFSQVTTFVCQPSRSAAPHTPRVILIGPCASGRATQAAIIATKYRLVAVSCDELVQQVLASNSTRGHACQAFIDKGMPIPDSMLLHLIKERLGRLDAVTRGWILYGYPRTREQAEALAAAGLTANRVFVLDISNDAIIERLTLQAVDAVTGNHYHLLYNPPRTTTIRDRLETHPDHSLDSVMFQLSEYQEHRDELIDYYRAQGCQRVHADQDIQTLFETIESLIVNPLPKSAATSN